MPETILAHAAAAFDAADGAARRLFHGRGQTVPGREFVTLDWYPPLLLLVLYREPDPAWLARLGAGLRQVAGERARGLLVQYRCRPGAPSACLWGEVPEPLDALEAGLRYRLHPGRAQNLGFFPDMAVGRDLVRSIAAGRRVLNLFAYTCSFSVAALAGGAAQVTNLDMHAPSLAIGRLNHTLNGLDLRRARFLDHDLFKSFGKLRQHGPYDLVILDPPGDQGRSFRARRDWPKLLGRLDDLLAPDGEVLAALAVPELGGDFLAAALARHFPQGELLARLTAGPDFPERDPNLGLNLFHLRRR